MSYNRLYPLIISSLSKENTSVAEASNNAQPSEAQLKESFSKFAKFAEPLLVPQFSHPDNLIKDERYYFNAKGFWKNYGYVAGPKPLLQAIDHYHCYYYGLKAYYNNNDWFLIGDDSINYSDDFLKKVDKILEQKEVEEADLILLSAFNDSSKEGNTSSASTSSESTANQENNSSAKKPLFKDALTTIKDCYDPRNNNMHCYLIRTSRAGKILLQQKSFNFFAKDYQSMGIFIKTLLSDVKKQVPLNKVLVVNQPLVVDQPFYVFAGNDRHDYLALMQGKRATKIDAYRYFFLNKFSLLRKTKSSFAKYLLTIVGGLKY